MIHFVYVYTHLTHHLTIGKIVFNVFQTERKRVVFANIREKVFNWFAYLYIQKLKKAITKVSYSPFHRYSFCFVFKRCFYTIEEVKGKNEEGGER